MPRTSRIFWVFAAAGLGGLASAWAADPTPTPTPAPTPIPNTVDLSNFKGRYRGTSNVSLDSGALHIGPSKIRISLPETTASKIVIQASVEAGGRTIPVGNQLTFASDGIVHGKNLAPGVLKNARLDGLYTATPRRLIFSGTYKLHKLTGRFTGTVTIGKQGRFTLRYSIFPGESPSAAFTYQYSGKSLR